MSKFIVLRQGDRELCLDWHVSGLTGEWTANVWENRYLNGRRVWASSPRRLTAKHAGSCMRLAFWYGFKLSGRPRTS